MTNAANVVMCALLLKLRRLLEKGTKYREQNKPEQNTVDWNLNKKILTKAVDDYTKNWSKCEGCHVSALEEWSETVKLIIQNKNQQPAAS